MAALLPYATIMLYQLWFAAFAAIAVTCEKSRKGSEKALRR